MGPGPIWGQHAQSAKFDAKTTPSQKSFFKTRL